jgi:uncharacterized membrane protein
MSEMNPYKPPESRVADAAAGGGDFIAEGRAVDAGRGWEWIAAGFGLFKQQPGTWVLITIAFGAGWIVIGMVPLLGALADMLLLQVVVGGILLGCRALETGEPFEFAHMFAGFKQNTGNLVILGVLALVAGIAILIPMFLIVGGGSFFGAMRGGGAGLAAIGASFFLGFLVTLALSVPVYMALWFAPALVVFHDLAPVDAMKTSFFACLKNIVPFLIYGVILFVLAIIAVIPFGLGMLVLIPVIWASVYSAYREIFFRA